MLTEHGGRGKREARAPDLATEAWQGEGGGEASEEFSGPPPSPLLKSHWPELCHVDTPPHREPPREVFFQPLE